MKLNLVASASAITLALFVSSAALADTPTTGPTTPGSTTTDNSNQGNATLGVADSKVRH